MSCVLLLLVTSGCVVPRLARLDHPPPNLVDPEVTVRWGVGDVIARAHPGGDANSGVRDYGPLKQQLEARLRSTLEGQAGLGHRAADADYEVSVELEIAESAGVSPWFGLGAGLETGVLVAGAAAGMAVGGPPGSLVGMLIATPVAIVAALAPPTTTELGEYEAKLIVRRRGGDVVASRHLRRSWRAELNGYHREQKLARESGPPMLELERALLDELRDALRGLPPSTPVARLD